MNVPTPEREPGHGHGPLPEPVPGADHEPGPWVLLRQDDNGNRYEISRFPSREEAEGAASEFEARGHKQLYYVEPEFRRTGRP